MPDRAGLALPQRWIDPGLQRTARLYRLVDHADPLAVRREAARRIQVARLAGMWPESDDTVHVEDTASEPGAGVAVRIYRPAASSAPSPVVMFMHGGAFISGGLDFEHPRCLEIARHTGFVIVSVDYRLAPEHPFPAGVDDCVSVFRWLLRDGPAMGADPARIAVAGSSAGGTLATAVCLRARDLGLTPPRFQLLLYPVIDDRLITSSMLAGTDTPAWNYPNCVHMWRHYLGPEPRHQVSPYAAPARAIDLSGLPAAYVMTAEHDPLRDEGDDYAGRLMDAGVPTELHRFSGTFHGFDTLGDAPVSTRARREHCDVLRGALT